jgi:RNA polymerase sigma-70 factor (ECF subfamily)
MSPQPDGTPAGKRSTDTSDAELLQAIAAGSEPAFEELRDRYRNAVAAVCRTIAGREREDCEQEVFARIWRKAALYDPARGSPAAWLLTLTRRTALNVRAGLRAPPPIGLGAEQDVERDDAGPADVDVFWLDGALGRLGERERTVIELAYFGDLSESAIARRLRVPLGSVKSWKRRGLNRLATLLGEESP